MSRGHYGNYRLAGRGAYGHDARVGASLLQTPGAVQSEMEQIDGDILSFSKEITDEVFRRGYPTAPGIDVDPVVIAFRSVWTPFIQSWQSWYANHSGWTDNVWTNHAPDAEKFQRSLIAIMRDLKAKGMNVHMPMPEEYSASILDPHHDVVDTLGDATKHIAGELDLLAKVAIYGGLGLLGVVVLTSVVHDMRAGNDPAQKYLDLARGRR